ncbi:MAG TPA: c-type cytochrome [Thermoanaerobaculia bacterium]|nr:c-type cytochrome [Thermoanaerobaculia bacterium]
MGGLLAALLLAALGVHAELTPDELRGRQIYRTGGSPSGEPIIALVGPEDLEIIATALPCMSCHGRDGRGKEEGGVRPSNLQWQQLTKPYSVPTTSGRSRPPYTPALLKRAITMGTDPGRQRLATVMPRYRLTMRHADDLVAYLKRIGTDTDPGLTDDSIALGMLLPQTAEGNSLREALTSHFERVNAMGGIFGRKVRLTENEEPFAFVAAHISGREREIGAMVAEKRIPTLAAFSTRIDSENRYLVHLLPGIEEQSRSLIGDAKVRIVHDAATADIATRLASHADPASSTVLFLSNADALAKLLASGTAKTILIPAAFTTDAIYSAPASTRILVALPTTHSARETALAAAKILTRALEAAGRDVDRESLLSFIAPNRRTPPRDSTILRVESGKLVRADTP